jgi:transcriptional regulator with XRE-family HTH domain
LDADGTARMEEKIDLQLGRRLRLRRRLMGLTQNQLALMVGVRFQQIQKYESGANRISASRLWRFCQALEVPVAYFFAGLPQGPGQTLAAPDDELMDRPESLDLIRVFHQLDERPRRRLLDLAKALNSPVGAT